MRKPVSTLCPMCESAEAGLLTVKHYHGRAFHLARCRHCGQHYCSPLPTASEIAEFYVGDYHANLRTVGESEREFGEKYARYRDFVLEFVKPGRSLDIGTSTGLFPNLLRAVGFHAEGLELNKHSAKWGEDHYNVRIRTCDLSQIGDELDTYDLISMTDVLEHTEHPLRFLQLARAYLKPDGCMLITFPDITSPESLYLRFLAILFRRGWIWSSCRIPKHVWEFTPATARVMFEKAGFEVLAFRRSQEELEPSAGVLRLLRAPLHLLSVHPLDRYFGTQMEFIIRRRTEPVSVADGHSSLTTNAK